MNTYTPGARITIVDVVSDPLTRAQPGQPSDPDGFLLVDDDTETITVWRPNGVVLTPTPTANHVSTGTYRFTFLIPMPPPAYPDSSIFGTWSWQTSGNSTAQGNSEIGTLNVVPTPS
jgi:hypothetical protein